MKYIDTIITKDELKTMSSRMFGGLVKAVVDIKKEVMVVDAEMHADEEAYLLERGSRQDDLWGINLYPDLMGDDFIEFDSMINVRPRLGNFSRDIKDVNIRKKIIEVVLRLVK